MARPLAGRGEHEYHNQQHHQHHHDHEHHHHHHHCHHYHHHHHHPHFCHQFLAGESHLRLFKLKLCLVGVDGVGSLLCILQLRHSGRSNHHHLIFNLATQVRRRKELQGEASCAAGEEEERECGAGECPRDCRWGPWGTWDPCSVTCGKGRQK